MKEFFETQFEPAADRPQRAQHMDHREYVQAAQFRKDFALTEEGAAFEAEAKSKRAYQTQFNECFKQIAPGRYADKPKTSNNKAVNKCLVGYKRKRRPPRSRTRVPMNNKSNFCLLYTSDAADEEDSVDLGGRRIIKKKKI
eukprot:TRINITY_DN19350_c0_g1_i1.p2 TRINITY_DN19350_c0_g1~~TRINITY_DN19350_c0_g1_i1.p2  ORF type:complete len:141 (+),score=46.64 TRINITY_DN19350_c0_g1_i1:280-702(+)